MPRTRKNEIILIPFRFYKDIIIYKHLQYITEPATTDVAVPV